MVFSSISESASYNRVDESDWIQAKRTKFDCMNKLYSTLRYDHERRLSYLWKSVYLLESECMHIINIQKRNQIITDFCAAITSMLNEDPVVQSKIEYLISETLEEIHEQPHRGKWGISIVLPGRNPKNTNDGDFEVFNFFSTPGSDRNQLSSKLGNLKFKYGAHNPSKYPPCLEYKLDFIYQNFEDTKTRYAILSEMDRYLQLLQDKKLIKEFCRHFPTLLPYDDLDVNLLQIKQAYEKVVAKIQGGEELIASDKPIAGKEPTKIGASTDSYWKDAFAFKGISRARTLRRCRNYKTHTERMADPDCLGYLKHYDGKSALHAIWHGGKRRKTRRR